METWGGQMFLTIVLFLLTAISIALLVFGMVVDDGGLAILGMSIAIPMSLALTVCVVMLFNFRERR